VKLVIPNCWFENIFFTYFGIEVSKQNFHAVLREMIEYTFFLLIKAVLRIINFILCWGMNIQNNVIIPATS
jgi:hypothetical protein